MTQNPPPGAPVFGTNPLTVNAWWNNLTTQQQNTYPITAAGYVGSTSGIPSSARDVANRALLGWTYSNLLDEYSKPSDSLTESKDTLKSKLIGISDLATRLNGFAVTGNIDPNNQFQHTRAGAVAGTPFLLQFSEEGQGRWAISIGNPDTVQTVVLTVPGVGRGLNNDLYQDISNNDASTNQLFKDGIQANQSAQIIWVGYDAPTSLTDPNLKLSTAADAAVGLQAFQQALLATRQQGTTPPHYTVIGHSFGSDVVAETTLNGHHLIADDIIFIGSPGVPVDTAADLVKNTITSSLPSGTTQVWASLTGKDPVQCIPTFLRLGRYPTDSEFGAKGFESDPNGDHGGYWEGVGLTNMADIETGHYTSVSTTSSFGNCI
jgi:hypothetical protein